MIGSVGSTSSRPSSSDFNKDFGSKDFGSTTSAKDTTSLADQEAAAQDVAASQQAQAFRQGYQGDSMSSGPTDYSSLSGASGVTPASQSANPSAVQDASAPYSLQAGQSSTAAPTDAASAVGSGSASGQQAVETASSFMGTPYNYSWDRSYTGAGTDPNGLGLMGPDGSIDCSQLTSMAHGGTLPADAATQGAMGPAMDPSTAQPGDIIAFDEHGTGEASHVGVADGQGNVIHASAFTGDVTVTPIDSIPSYNTWAVHPS